MAGPDRPHRRGPRRGRDRARREVREAPRRVPLGARGAQARRGAPGVRRARPLGGRREHVVRGGGPAARRGRRRARPRRLRLPRLGGEDPRVPDRPRAADPVPRHLPRHARRRLRVRAARVRARRCELDRDGSRDSASGHRPAARAEGDRGPRRHDAAGRAGGRGGRGDAHARRLRRGRHPRAPPASLRGEQPLSPDPRRARPRRLRDVPGGSPRRDRRAARPPVVRREPVPPRVQVAPDAAPRRSSASSSAPRSSEAVPGQRGCGARRRRR